MSNSKLMYYYLFRIGQYVYEKSQKEEFLQVLFFLYIFNKILNNLIINFVFHLLYSSLYTLFK